MKIIKVLKYWKMIIFIFMAILSYSLVVWFIARNAQYLSNIEAAALIASGTAIVTGILALLKEALWSWVKSPRLAIKFYPFDKRDCLSLTFHISQMGSKGLPIIFDAPGHYFRLRVYNLGLETAEDVDVTLEEVQRLENGNYVIDEDFMPLKLFWSHWKQERYELWIPSSVFRHCDLGFIVHPNYDNQVYPPKDKQEDKLLFWFEVFRRPTAGRTSLLPGAYKIKISALGRNASKVMKTLEFEWKGEWSDKIDQMLDKYFIPKAGFESGHGIEEL